MKDSSSTDPGAEGGACGAVPSGWAPALFNTGLDACPAGFPEHVVLGSPSVGPGACACGCSVTQTGVCDQGPLTFTAAPGHGIDTCTSTWFTTPAGGSSCIAVPAAAQTPFEAYAAAPMMPIGRGGTCSSAAQANPAALSEPPQRFCEVPAANADGVCAGNAPAGFSACIVAAGTVACPAGTPFIHSFSVEDAAVLSCGSCSACSTSTTCSNPSVAAFVNATCTAPVAFTFPVDGTCVAAGAETVVLSIQLSATAATTCAAGTSAAEVQLTGAQTLCCR